MSNNLKETINNLQKDFIANPKNALVQYESNSILKEGLQSVVTLREHKLVHSDERPFACVSCDKKFKSVKNLRDHKRVHAGRKP